MTDHHHDNPFVTISLSILLGMASWLSDPNVWRAIAVAALCGFIGGLFKAAGFHAWNRVRDRRTTANKKPEA